eukprot:6198371-Pleurochrysis_carterae.AAC.6
MLCSSGMVLSALSNKVTSKFKAFCKTELMDRFLHSCIEYFAAFFDLQQYLSEVAEEASRSESIKAGWPRDVDETRPHAVGLGVQPGRVVELEELAGARLRDVAALYAAILVQHSNYANTQQVGRSHARELVCGVVCAPQWHRMPLKCTRFCLTFRFARLARGMAPTRIKDFVQTPTARMLSSHSRYTRCFYCGSAALHEGHF